MTTPTDSGDPPKPLRQRAAEGAFTIAAGIGSVIAFIVTALVFFATVYELYQKAGLFWGILYFVFGGSFTIMLVQTIAGLLALALARENCVRDRLGVVPAHRKMS